VIRSPRAVVLVTTVVLAATAVAGCGSSSSAGGAQGASSDTSQKEGTVATDFAGRDVEGKTLRLSDYLGKQAVLIDFWATYCQPCLAEMPHLRRLYEAQKAKGFVVIAVSMDGPETVADVPAFAKRNGMVFPVVLDEDSQIASVYNPKKSAPLSILIDKSGKVVKTHEGYNPGDEDVLAHEVAMVLDQPPQAK
jgi:peroxiredoxin